MSKIVRSDIADFLTIKSTGLFELMGTGFNTLNETVGAQIESKTYICDTNESSVIKSYKRQFAFDLDLIVGDPATLAIEEIYKIGRDSKVGTDAEREYVRLEEFDPAVANSQRYFKARKFKVAVEVSNFNGAGGETVTVSGNLNCIGDPVQGYFDKETKLFTAGEYTETLGALTVASVAGTLVGDTKITVTEPLAVGYSYVYKTANTVTAPLLNDSCTTYTMWNGLSDITAVTGDKICIVAVDDQYKAKKSGIATVTAKA